ncbi:MAG: four helix bundle protein [Verrucomicrobia bacterium]|nr:four helix bundle protein [Verrucomicrobiota bacterium]
MSQENIRTLEDLECWKACRDLRNFVRRKIVPVLPREETYRLSDQLIRSSRSTTANIAEGYGRYHYLDNAKFTSNSRGSCWEVLDHLITANDDSFISGDLLCEGRDLVNRAVKLINGFISYLQRASKNQSSAH